MTDHARAEWWRPDFEVASGPRSTPTDAVKPQVSGSAAPYWAMMTFTVILLLAPQSFFPALAPFRIALLTGLAAITTYVFDKLTRGQPIIMRTREMRITACLIAWIFLTIPFSLRPGESLSFLFETYFKSLAIFWLLSHTVNTLPRLRQVAWALTLLTILATTIALYLWKFHKRHEGGWAVAGLVVALICLPLVPSSYFDRVSTILNKEADPTGSAQARWRDMVAAAKVTVQNPIVGVGLRMNALALAEERGPDWDPMGRYLLDVHDVYLVYASELGIPGLVLFLMLLVSCMKSAISGQRRSARVPA